MPVHESRCAINSSRKETVRRAWLLGEGQEDRKQWIEDRLRELSQVFAMEIAGYAVLDSHLHVLVRLCPDRVPTSSDEDVVWRWARVVPLRGPDREPLEISQAWLDQKLADAPFVARTRHRLADLGWFMKCLKEPLARLANREASGSSSAPARKPGWWTSRFPWGTGGMPGTSPLHITGSEATLRGSRGCVTTLLASVGRCSKPERIHQAIRCFATTLLASVERCSG